MTVYRAPIRDMRFILHDVIGAGAALRGLPGLADVSSELMDQVLEEAGRFVEGVVHPINRPGDEEGCVLEDGTVRMPESYKQAYAAWVEAEWGSLACDPDYGGQGLPRVLDFMVTEMVCSGSLAFSIFPGLTRGAWHCIASHAGEDLKARYLPRMASGEWPGVMALTEPQAGTDLGLLKTRAEPAADGSFRITGSKMFISAGDHDMAENIIHLVLARLPDAPAGTRGISLFLVPKMLPDGSRNAFSCGSIEHKMGLHCSPTCVMNYDGATGWMVGEPHRGLPAMFTMMNAERLFVGVQGIGAGECAWQSALAYARERLQGRSPAGPRHPELPADPITVHPDVQRMLLTARATTEAGRALAAWTAVQLERAERLPPGPEREEADDLAALMTPIVKAAGTDFGFEACVLAQQVFGGHGYVREWGVEQLVRDVRIAQVYEGTNGIQALDLALRKRSMQGGRLPRRFFALVHDFIRANAEAPRMARFLEPLAAVLASVEDCTAFLAKEEGVDPLAVPAAATDYLRLFALLAYGWMWARMARACLDAGDARDAFHEAKLAAADFFMGRVLPQHLSLAAQIRTGSRHLDERGLAVG